MARDSIPSDVWRTIYEAVDVEEGNAAKLVNPEVTSSLRAMSELPQ